MSIALPAIKATLAIAAHTLPVIGITLMITELLSAWGVLRRIQVFLCPLLRLARLPAATGPALVTAFGSALSANTMIAADYRHGRLDKGQALLAAQANTLPGYITETVTYMLPVMLPALGGAPGSFYLAAFILTGLIKGILIVIVGRRLASEKWQADSTLQTGSLWTNRPDAFVVALKRSTRMFVRIAVILMGTSLLTTLALHGGLLSLAVESLAPVLFYFDLPGSLVVPILGYAFSPLAGATAIGALFKSAAVSAYTATLAALLGSLLALPVFALRSSMARNISVFGLRLGILNTLITVGIGVLSRLGLILLVPFFFKAMMTH